MKFTVFFFLVLLVLPSCFKAKRTNSASGPYVSVPFTERRIQYYLNKKEGRVPIDLKVPANPDTFSPNKVFLVDDNYLSKYRYPNPRSSLARGYLAYVVGLLRDLEDKKLLQKKFLLLFGDNTSKLGGQSVLVKSRPVGSESLVLLNMNKARHWGLVGTVNEYDIPFQKKKDTLIWRGVTTGAKNNDLENSQNPKRFWLVKKYFSEDWCDIGFNKIVQNNTDYSKYLKGSLSMQEQLKSKFIISMEGNDVASGLKWQLYSNSVVLMPKPTVVSWAMEDTLKPYVHYIPLKDDLSDLREVFEWAKNNPEQCELIAKNATRYIESFLDEENEVKVEREVLKRYLQNITYEN